MNKKYEVSLLIIRVVLGITFLIHGIAKFQMGLGNVAGWFESIGIMGSLAYLVTIIEFAGGIALIVGLGTKIVSALISIVMIGAVITSKLPVGFLGNGQAAGYELDIALLAMAVALIFSGSQLFALDSKFSNSKQKVNETMAKVS